MEQDSLFDMQADPATQNRLNTISKWGKFISISGLVICGLVVLALAAAGAKAMDQIADTMKINKNIMGLMIAVSVMYAALFIAWLVLLLRASSQIKQGLMTRNNERLAEGFKSLKTYFAISVIISVVSTIYTLYTMFAY